LELLSGNLVESVAGEKECILCVMEWVWEQDAQLVNHLDNPEDQRLVRVVALLEV
jgi:hypothetical protein